MRSLRLSLLVLAAAAAGCSSMQIRTEYDTAAQFKDYRTYAWVAAAPGPEEAPAIRDPQVYARVVEAVEREMARKGLVRAPPETTPDFLVSVHGWSRNRIDVVNYGYAYGGSYAYGPYPAAGAVPITEVREYTEGTLLLDFVDATTKKLVWRGTATDTITSPGSVRETIDTAARKLLDAYPPR
jgi:hypothetical protein